MATRSISEVNNAILEDVIEKDYDYKLQFFKKQKLCKQI